MLGRRAFGHRSTPCQHSMAVYCAELVGFSEIEIMANKNSYGISLVFLKSRGDIHLFPKHASGEILLWSEKSHIIIIIIISILILKCAVYDLWRRLHKRVDQGMAQSRPEVVIDDSRESTSTKLVGPGAVQVNHHLMRGPGDRPQ